MTTTDATVSQPTNRQTLRLAAVITGGVSLAVWMGGVARELNLLTAPVRPTFQRSALTRRTQQLYGQLCEVLGWDIELDVLAGTSAGGINAALLGICAACGGDLENLRKLWMEKGDFDTLLRDPSESAPRSLLQGDGVLLTGIADALADIRTTIPKDTEPTPTWLNITTTLLQGEATRFTDSFGTAVQDSDHLGLFTFTENDLIVQENDAALALAARCSASFPGAFEPAFVPACVAQDPQHPAMSRFLSSTVDHYASDGGQLENQPITPALNAIFDRPDADDPVRRVMLYVVPSTAPGAQKPADAAAAPPSLARALFSDFQASRSQSVKSALDDINANNSTAQVRSDGIRRLACIATSTAGVALVDESTYTAYRKLRATEIAAPVVETLLTQLFGQARALPGTTATPAALTAAATGQLLDGAAQSAPAPAGGSVGPLAVASIPRTFPRAPDTDNLAKLGLVALDDARSVLLELRKRAYLLIEPADFEVRAAFAGLWEQLSWKPSGSATRGAQEPKTLWSTVQTARAANPIDSDAAAARAASDWAQHLCEGEPQNPLAKIWTNLDEKLPEFIGRLDALVSGYKEWRGKYPLSSTRRDAAWAYVSDLVAFLKPAPVDRLAQLHVISHLLLPRGRAASQPVEFIQVSADTRSDLDPQRTRAIDKLTGFQLNHFGAFYRGSWRANDWMWGRIDGAGWLVHMLLSPSRIINLCDESVNPDLFPAAFCDQLEAIAGTAPPKKVKDELDNLFDASTLQPAALPETAIWVAAALQSTIAQEELANIASELQAEAPDIPRNADEASFLRVYREEANVSNGPIPIPPPSIVKVDQAARVLQACQVSRERLGAQQKSPLFVKTVVKSAAVLAATVNGAEAKPPSMLRPAMLLARHGTRAAYEIVNRVTQGRYFQTAIAALAAIAAGITLSTNGDDVLEAAGAVCIVGGIVLALAVLRPVALWVARLVVVLGALAVVLAGFIPELRNHIFPWLENTALPWLSHNKFIWALIVLLVFLPPFTTIAGAALHQLGKRKATARAKAAAVVAAGATAPAAPSAPVAGAAAVVAAAPVVAPEPAAVRSLFDQTELAVRLAFVSRAGFGASTSDAVCEMCSYV